MPGSSTDPDSGSSRIPAIGDVRGSGLFWGLELVRGRDTREPAPGLAKAAIEGLRDQGVLIGSAGRDENVLKIRPPMCLSREQVDFLLERLGRVLAGQVS